MVSMRGEWHHRRGGKMILLGGHAINVVGYTDSYTDEWGNRGGFIIRNSWNDGLGTAHGSNGRGSHSAAYYMRDVFDFDEALSCPNPHSPRSWYACKDIAECKSPLTALQAQVARKPLELACTDNSAVLFDVCERNASYYLANLTEFDSDGLFTACFLRASDNGAGRADLCTPPLLIDDLASILTPRTITHINDPTVCGYHFLPYNTLEAIRSRFGAVAAGDFDIEWSRASYVSQRSDVDVAAQYDYTLMERSMLPMPKTGAQAGALWVRR